MQTLDIEVFENYFLAQFKDMTTGTIRYFEQYDGAKFDGRSAMRQLKSDTTVTFNGTKFDLPLFGQACAGKTCVELKALSDQIIVGDKPHWELGIAAPNCDHIDLIEVAPGIASLKTYGGRMHTRKMQDLPIAPNDSIRPEQRVLLREYCENDLDNTAALYQALEKRIKLRETMSAEYGIDLRSKSDAQIAEAVIKTEVVKRKGQDVRRPRISPGTTFRYTPPDFIQFQTENLRQVLTFVTAAVFSIEANGAPTCKALENLKVNVGNATYRMGIGGLHSSEKSCASFADDDHILVDRDVASYYPAIILNCNLYPSHMGREFLDVYREIVDRRLAAKAAGDTTVAESLKITINGSFGKLGSKYSILYSPDLLIQTTITGQLSLLMLIESLEEHGITVISANTDGIVIRCPKNKCDEMDSLVALWEFWTGFKTEAAHYRALYSRDVNNYLAVKTNGDIKTKGIFAQTGLQKSPAGEICSDAVIAYLANGAPIETTIRDCRDIRKFVTIRTVKGGALWNGISLGKTVRWYYSTTHRSTTINYQSNGNKVAKSEGGRPVMQLPETLPSDIDYEKYIAEARSILCDIGA